jgi:hypothetical protein
MFNLGPPSPNSAYSSSSSQQVARNGAPGYPSPQNQSAFAAYVTYMSPSSATAASASASYANQMPRVRGPYLNPLSFLPQPIVDSKQQTANAYAHHALLMPSKNGSIMNGYPLQSQQ